jgi:hypothetical protein
MFTNSNNKTISPASNAGEQKIDEQAKQEPSASELASEKASKVSPGASEKKGGVEDLFAETEREVDKQERKPDVFQPKEKILETGREEVSPATPASSAGTKKKIFILAGLVIGLLAIGGGGFWAFYLYSGTTEEDMAGKIITPVQTTIIEEEEAEIKSEEQKEDTTSVSKPLDVSPSSTLDSDNDGLTDEEERALGMDINSVDSDNDGLFDRIEVKVYKTDPLNPDTDGDGFLDGEEVKDGYNPKGEGRLYKLK